MPSAGVFVWAVVVTVCEELHGEMLCAVAAACSAEQKTESRASTRSATLATAGLAVSCFTVPCIFACSFFKNVDSRFQPAM